VSSDPASSAPVPATAASYPVAAVARRLGVAPATLRTWDRRYRLGPTAHAFGAHRRYTPADVARLLVMRQLVVDGVPPADAARIALASGPASSPADPAAGDGRVPPGDGAQPGEPDGPVGAAGGRAARDRVTGPARRGGGRILALPGAPPEVRGLARAAMALDAQTMTVTIRAALRSAGVDDTWHRLLVPVLTAIGERWSSTGEGVEVEHLLSECALVGLREIRLTARLPGDPRVVLGCVADDYHALPVHVLAAALAERGVPVRVLGAAVPPEALTAAVRRVRPAVAFCWASQGTAVDLGYLGAVPALAPPVAVVVGGPGWPASGLPGRVQRARDVPEAVALVSAYLTADAGA
jgi:DNA-binding transcriptional MerR regulator